MIKTVFLKKRFPIQKYGGTISVSFFVSLHKEFFYASV